MPQNRQYATFAVDGNTSCVSMHSLMRVCKPATCVSWLIQGMPCMFVRHRMSGLTGTAIVDCCSHLEYMVRAARKKFMPNLFCCCRIRPRALLAPPRQRHRAKCIAQLLLQCSNLHSHEHRTNGSSLVNVYKEHMSARGAEWAPPQSTLLAMARPKCLQGAS